VVPSEALSHPFFQLRLEQKGRPASSHCAVQFNDTLLTRGVPRSWKENSTGNAYQYCFFKLMLTAACRKKLKGTHRMFLGFLTFL